MKVISVIHSLADVVKNPVVTFGLGATTVMLADTWFNVSTTDFVSSGANVAMAIVAYKAYLVGRDYIGQMTTQEGYKKAIEFKNTALPKLSHFNFLKHDIGRLKKLLEDYDRANILDAEFIESIASVNDFIRKNSPTIESQCLSLSGALNLISTYGIVPTDDKKEYLNEALRFSMHLSFKAYLISVHVDVFLTPYYMNYSSGNSNRVSLIGINICEKHSDKNDLDAALKLCDEVLSDELIITSHLKKFNSGDSKHIKNYFTKEND